MRLTTSETTAHCMRMNRIVACSVRKAIGDRPAPVEIAAALTSRGHLQRGASYSRHMDLRVAQYTSHHMRLVHQDTAPTGTPRPHSNSTAQPHASVEATAMACHRTHYIASMRPLGAQKMDASACKHLAWDRSRLIRSKERSSVHVQTSEPSSPRTISGASVAINLALV